MMMLLSSSLIKGVGWLKLFVVGSGDVSAEGQLGDLMDGLASSEIAVQRMGNTYIYTGMRISHNYEQKPPINNDYNLRIQLQIGDLNECSIGV